MNKALLKEFRQAAAELPELLYKVKEPHDVSGAELMLTGTREVDGKPIDENVMYKMKMPAYYPVNHFRRMKRIYAEISRQQGHKEGYRAVMDYCTQVIYLKKQQDEN